MVHDDGRIFFQKRSPARKLFPDTWDIVGGHVEPGESVEEALRRETTEETGWQISVVLAALEPCSWTGDDGLARVESDFLVRVDGDLERPRLEQGKHTEFRWLAEHELDLLQENRAPDDTMLRRIVEQGFAALRLLGLS
ncbi:hypothetical protein GCM10012284_30030 [Mangrovihabitans endophyticus]|uniref:Nudix hydrolase domain-containing protein n=1 Tax=Mangrovihabitans endophyticus TaxID=1751298 RepID=A0A8J3C0Z4_9ACTN|nr:hypothetical protein GCM10012284_30030 [Mangrovihabitans endophyticus]